MDDGNATNDTTGGRVARASRITDTPKKKLFNFFLSLGGNQSFEAITKHDIVQEIVRDYSLKKSQVRNQWCNYRKSQRPPGAQDEGGQNTVTGGTDAEQTTANDDGGAQEGRVATQTEEKDEETSASEQSGKTKRISKAAVEELFQYFQGKKYPFNKAAPRVNSYDNELLDIAVRYQLHHGQVKRQLVKWKDNFYNYAGIEYSFDSEAIRYKITLHMSLNFEDFVVDTINKMIPSKATVEEEDRNRAFHEKYCTQQREGEKRLTLIRDKPIFIDFFVEIVNDYTDFAVALFPKTASMVSHKELGFSALRMKNIRNQWRDKFIDLVCSEFGESFQEDFELECSWRHLLCDSEDILFRSWACLNYSNSLPPIELSKVQPVHKYSLGVLYFTTGWIVNKLSTAKDIKTPEMKQLAGEFAARHTLTKGQAMELGLPTKVVDRKEIKSLVRPSKEFFEFICRLESIYIANVTVDMMQLYSAGDLLGAIFQAIFVNEETMIGFCCLLGDLEVDDGAVRKFLRYIMTKFQRMRGRWLSKAIDGQTTKGDDAVDKMSTRYNVASVQRAAKVSASVKREQKEDVVVVVNKKDGLSRMYEAAAEVVVEGSFDLTDDQDNEDETDELFI
jgi:hypothetical protein